MFRSNRYLIPCKWRICKSKNPLSSFVSLDQHILHKCIHWDSAVGTALDWATHPKQLGSDNIPSIENHTKDWFFCEQSEIANLDDERVFCDKACKVDVLDQKLICIRKTMLILQGYLTWLPQIADIAEFVAYRAKACWQNWITALVDSKMRPVLNKKLLMRVAPGFMGWTVKTRKLRPTFRQPLTVTAANKWLYCKCSAHQIQWVSWHSCHAWEIMGPARSFKYNKVLIAFWTTQLLMLKARVQDRFDKVLLTSIDLHCLW